MKASKIRAVLAEIHAELESDFEVVDLKIKGNELKVYYKEDSSTDYINVYKVET